jgi:hypothetical protein
MNGLKISKDLALPWDAITQTFSILAMRRIGKTYTASVMAEEFVAASLPFVALDPTGAWWGLRATADGKAEGLPVIIIGGEHGDVPLEATAGKVIADLVVDHPGCYVVDMSATESNAEQDRFATDFAERLYRRKNKVRTPLHLFVDEADSFAPQKPMPGQQRMLGAFEALVRRGGIRGIGTTLITQRPAVLNKNVLTQVECLIVLNMNAPQDQDAIDDWVKRNGTKEQRDTMMQSLASLQQGEAWFWSPNWLRIFKKVRIRERRTFNSSATPKAGEKVIVPQQLAPVDLVRLGKEITETIERASENDPTVLKRKNAELRQKLAQMERLMQPVNKSPEQIEIEKPKIVEIPTLTDRERAVFEEIAGWMAQINASLGVAKEFLNVLPSVRQDILNRLSFAQRMPLRPQKLTSLPPVRRTVPNPVSALPRPGKTVSVEVDAGDIRLGKCERSILAALIQYPQGRSAIQVAVLTGYSCNSGGFNNALGKLRSLEYITRGSPIKITEGGEARLGNSWEPLPEGEDLVKYWLAQLPKCERIILETLVKIYPDGLGSQELGEQTGYSSNSGGFNNALGRLRTLELVSRGQPIKASENLFP